VVAGGFNTVFGATLDDITAGSNSGDYDICFTHAVPEPSAMALLAIAGLAGLCFRRR